MNHLLSGLAANPALPPDLVDHLIAHADDDLADDLATRPDLTHPQALALLSRVPDSAVRLAHEGRLTATDIDPVTHPDAALALLDNRAGTPEWARLFAADPSVERRKCLAACPGLPADVVTTLALDAEVRVVAELALWAAPDVTAELAGHPHAEVRRAVALNEATPADVLTALLTGEGLPPALRCLVCDQEDTPFVHDRNCPRPDCDLPPDAACDGTHESTVHAVRLAALANPATPAAALAPFATHPSTLLRRALAARPDLPADSCEQLATDPVPGIRADLAANPATGESLIRSLADDPSHDIRRGLAHHPHIPLDVLIHLAATTKLSDGPLPRLTTATPTEVKQLARSPHPAARMLVARLPHLPATIRDALANDPDARVTKSLAPQPGLNEAQLRSILNRHGSQAAAKLAANPGAPPALLEELARHDPPAKKALGEIARHPHATPPALLACLTDRRARITAAGHPTLPPPVIVGLLTDPDGEVVEAAAANPSLPAATMAAILVGG
ncbi:hypothetical protein [Streptomyces sp. NPDC051561]|uniref:hypothetical protein n=1 Tax=Streptomyces sp. NPDC051561 TaxID=3365658 RepID=UPI0037AA74B3